MLDLQYLKKLAILCAGALVALWALGVIVGKIGLLAIVAGSSFIGWQTFKRVVDHMRNNPEAAKLVAEHVIAPLLTGDYAKEKPLKIEVKKTKGTLI